MKHIGTKIINAQPMTRQQYNDLRGWTVPGDENPGDDGYLVEYLDGGSANHPDYKGYISWSPKEVFDRAYRPVSAMTFGDALVMLKEGHRVCRAGWNGKGMWLYLIPAEVMGVISVRPPASSKNPSEQYKPHASIAMKTADGSLVVGWLASQTDMLADDWMLVED